MTPLEQLLEHAEQATPGERIELRDSIAAHGTDALAALSTWLEGARLGLFAARVIERIAKDHRQPALRALRDARDGVPATVGREIDAIVERLDPLGNAPRSMRAGTAGLARPPPPSGS